MTLTAQRVITYYFIEFQYYTVFVGTTGVNIVQKWLLNKYQPARDWAG